MNNTSKYDFVILGGGAAGLSLAHRMMNHSYFATKKIALVEREQKTKNDRTWCFWEKGSGKYDNVVYRSWENIHFYSKALEKKESINPYHYKMIKGIDFYNYVYAELANASHIDIIHAEVERIEEHENQATIHLLDQGELTTKQVFKSYPSIDHIDSDKHIHVLQHFKGYVIETKRPTFDPECATFMDFRIDQKGDARFLYVLPHSPTKALVEVALFSNTLLDQPAYDKILTDYIKDFLEIKSYCIEEEEFGVIPMSTYPFADHNTKNIFHIGTGGGIVKASSGYAFSRIQKHSDQLIDAIVNGQPLKNSYNGLHGRHLFYDKIMLHAMLKNGVSGEDIFTNLFKKKNAPQIFKFLDQETSHLEDIGIFRAPPMWPFTKSFFTLLVGNG